MTKQSRPDLDSETHNKATDKNTDEKINTEKSTQILNQDQCILIPP